MKLKISDKGKQRLLSGHPWVFRSDVVSTLPPQPGIISVLDKSEKFLGQALYSPHSQITLRWLTFKDEKIDREFWKNRMASAIGFRSQIPIASNACRLIYGEVDGIPSFVVDRYENAISFQMLSAGLETQRECLIDLLHEIVKPELIVERNDVSVRKLEQLPLCQQILFGTGASQVEIWEENLKFEVDLLEGQKTGAFLDQRENRIKAGFFSKNSKRILDVFSYEGWFACHFAQNANEVIAVEQSERAVQKIKLNAEKNKFKNISVISENAFDVLKKLDAQKEKFDLINLDPPAFAKSASQIKQALNGYKEIHLRAMRLLRKDGILITSSCSHHLSEDAMLKVIVDAAKDAKRTIQIFGMGAQSADHPILPRFPESKYLKCFFLRVW